MAGLPGSIPGLMPAGDDELVRRLADLERIVRELGPSVSGSFKPVIDDLATKQAALNAQVAFLSTQSVGYSSTKDWYVSTGTSGIGAWEVLAYNPTFDDEYSFLSSSTGILKIELSSAVLINNGSSVQGGTALGYSLAWPGGSLGYAGPNAARLGGTNMGNIRVGIANTSIVAVPGNTLITLRTVRAKWSPIAPDTTWHGTRDTTVVVTRVGI